MAQVVIGADAAMCDKHSAFFDAIFVKSSKDAALVSILSNFSFFEPKWC